MRKYDISKSRPDLKILGSFEFFLQAIPRIWLRKWLATNSGWKFVTWPWIRMVKRANPKSAVTSTLRHSDQKSVKSIRKFISHFKVGRGSPISKQLNTFLQFIKQFLDFYYVHEIKWRSLNSEYTNFLHQFFSVLIWADEKENQFLYGTKNPVKQ